MLLPQPSEAEVESDPRAGLRPQSSREEMRAKAPISVFFSPTRAPRAQMVTTPFCYRSIRDISIKPIM